MSVLSQVSNFPTAPGEFLVLIPFSKKEKPQIEKTGLFETSSDYAKETLISNKFADSTYSDMMQEFSSLHEEESNSVSNDKPECNNAYSMPFGCISSDPLETKRKRGAECDDQGGRPYDFLWSVMRSTSKNALERQNCEKFVEVLESVNCLSDPYSGKCMLLREASRRSTGREMNKSSGDNSSCLCPVWLKKIMEAFAFVSIFSAHLQLRREKVILSHVKGALNQLEKFGVRVGIEDIENLAVLCPKVVQFANDDMESKNYDDSIVIINVSTEERDKVEDNLGSGQKAISLSKIFNAMKKRERSFKTNLWEAVNLLMDKSQLLPLEMVEHLRKGIGSQGQMVHVEDIGARKAVLVEIPDALLDNTKSALKSTGISKLYSHQAESIMASLAGKNVVVATMTSSGKSLCYNLPVLEALSHDLSSSALYMFPTKALAQDQLRALLAMTKAFDASIDIGVYDGDTTQKDRMWLRDNARLLITNPDMLHMSILPYHGQFSRILSNLRLIAFSLVTTEVYLIFLFIRFVVIDEAHAYKGAFGCHTALILRRLCRLCSHVYGSDPSFVFSTATSANPREHCMELANLSTLELIQNDGSPCAQKLFVLWNPTSCLRSVLNKSQTDIDDTRNAANKTSSPISEVSYLFAEMVQHGLRCIAFCRSRKLCELVLSYTREILEETAPHLVDSICVYRAGYVAEDRRRIERDFFGGKLCGVAATNALELGIDVGHIDVTLHLGFPGSIASLWQQAGRSGRRERPSLAVYVAFEGPLDQYFMKYPEKLFKSPIECCHIDAQNHKVLEQHLVCAALEHPLSLIYDEKYFGSGLSSGITTLKNRGYLSSDPSLDSSAKIFEYIGHEVYEGAVYMHQGHTYLVKELNLSSKIALCQKADLKYFTKTRDYTDIHVSGGNNAVWIQVPQSVKAVVEQNFSFRSGLHAASHALLHVVPIYVRCNFSDLAPECPNPHDSRYFPERILLYDRHPGGTGVSKQIQPYFTELLVAALELVTSCHCLGESGCPNCVQNLDCHEYNELIHKEAAIMIIKGVLEAEKSFFEGLPNSLKPL
ncbi:UBQ helicase-c and DEAD-like helicase domain-containing protein [Citrus sinensis]|uniref:UBQ helicase-c and DEAD-like helicase domain-containing protein n=1 Tax=Citrus sinensis TaxID=2711 RepID=A0ACB8LXW2_CITSI|nr:UBQ helicase-c and DEAD-like helicase domain-containing protein [Citrus sinensis]